MKDTVVSIHIHKESKAFSIGVHKANQEYPNWKLKRKMDKMKSVYNQYLKGNFRIQEINRFCNNSFYQAAVATNFTGWKDFAFYRIKRDDVKQAKEYLIEEMEKQGYHYFGSRKYFASLPKGNLVKNTNWDAPLPKKQETVYNFIIDFAKLLSTLGAKFSNTSPENIARFILPKVEYDDNPSIETFADSFFVNKFQNKTVKNRMDIIDIVMAMNTK